MAAFSWRAAGRNYEAEKRKMRNELEETIHHPLKGIAVTMSESRVKGSGKEAKKNHERTSRPQDPLRSALEGSDPLSQMAAEADPLNQMAAEMSLSQTRKNSRSGSMSSVSSMASDCDESLETWSSKRSGILSKYTTSEKLTITTSFLSASDKEKVMVKAQVNTVSDKVRNRLEQLDDFEEGSVQEMLNLSQQDYVNRIEELNSRLILAWDQDQRVKALKIAIQCAKLLVDVSVIQFYPSKFVLITDILDTFGRLVYNRIKTKASIASRGSAHAFHLPDNFTSDQVPETAKETCRNWFFKIASIRELVPRFYVEAAILKSYSYLTTGEYKEALLRLASMTRGIGDPLVAIYARCYLCRVGIVVAPKIRDHLIPCFDDFLFSYSQIQGDGVQNILAVQKLELPRYFTLYSPALDWLLQCVARNATENVLVEVLAKSKCHCNSALLLNSVMQAFQAEYITSRTLQFTEMIRECEETGFPKCLLYQTLGSCLATSMPPDDQKMTILNEVWTIITKLTNSLDYVNCAEAWLEFVVIHFTKREVNTFLGDIIKHMLPDRAYENHYAQLQSIVSKILEHLHDFSVLFSMDKFLPFLDMFQKESIKVEVCKNLTESYIKWQTEPTSDPVITNAFMFVCKTMHDSVDALTLNDDIRSIGQLIIGFIRTISFGRDFEQQLGFYVEARASFSNIDSVLVYLVQSVNRLVMDTRRIVKGNHSRKTAAYVRACVAYCFITIPSLSNIFTQLHLYLVSGQVAVFNQCFSQGDAFFKAAISLVAEVPRTLALDGKIRPTEPLLHDYLNHFIASLLFVPDSPDQGVLYLLKGLLNVLQNYPWETHTDTKCLLFVNVLSVLSATSQEAFIHHIDKVDCNDTLYGHDRKYLAEVDKMADTLLEEILNQLKLLDKPELHKRQAHLGLELFNRIIVHADLDNEQVFVLAAHLWKLISKHGHLDTRVLVRTLGHVKRRGAEKDHAAFAELALRMPLQSRA